MSTQATDSAHDVSFNKLNHQIGLYSLAAAVAGVSVLAMSQPAAGEVVITKKTIHIPLAPRDMQEPVKISMANNGVDNFSFILSSSGSSLGLRELLVGGVNPGQSGAHNQMLIGGDFYAKALALPRGAKIGPAPSFGSYGALVEGTNTSNGVFNSRGYWGGNPQNRFLGVRFQIQGKTHYGWIRLTITSNVKLKKPTLSATITGYAYETVANKPISAGAASAAATAEKRTADLQVPEKLQNQSAPSLGMLALGAQSLTMWRREETLTSN